MHLQLLSAIYLANCVQPRRIEVKRSSIHGFGIFSTEEISEGELIFAERPAFTVSQKENEFTEETVQDVLKNLSPAERAIFDQLYTGSSPDCSSTTPNLKLFMANAFEIEGPVKSAVCDCDSKALVVKALFVAAARLNHSPIPNASMGFWVQEKGQQEFMAIEHIKKGEEITISYDSVVRQTEAHNGESFFRCSCQICSATPSKRPPWAEAEEHPTADAPTVGSSGGVTGAALVSMLPRTAEELQMVLNVQRTSNGEISQNASNFASGMAAGAGDDEEILHDDSNNYEEADSDEACYSDGDDDDLGNLDIRPGTHTWLE